MLRVPQAFSRAELERLEELAKEWGAKGLAYIVWEDGEPRSPIAKFLSEAELEAFRGEPAETVLFVADDARRVRTRARQPPATLGDELGLLDERRVRVGLDRRLPDVRLGGGRRALAGEPPSVHAARSGWEEPLRQGA